MLTATTKFSDHLRSSHTPTFKVGVWTPDLAGVYELVGYLGVESGSLSIDYRRNIRRQASLRVSSLNSASDTDYDTRLDTRDYLEALTSNSAEITIHWGLDYPDGSSESLVIARLRVEESTRTVSSFLLDITAAYDGGSRVADFSLVTPYAPYDIAGTKLTYVEAIQDLVDVSYPSAAPPDWTITAGVDITSLPPDNTAFTGDRWTAVQALAQAINVTVGVDAVGGWVIAPATAGTVPCWTVNYGPTGILVNETTQYSRVDQFNGIPIRWESPTGGGGLAYIVDADPLSPTYYDGPFGRKPRPEETLDTVTTSDQAVAAATTLLAEYSGKTRSVSLTSVHNPLIEPGDVFTLILPDGSVEDHTVDAVALGFGAATMTLETRIVRTTTGGAG